MAGYTEHINIVVQNLEDGGCSKEIVAQFVELAGILHGSFVSVFLKQHIHGRMASLGEKKIGIWGILPASALGILSPLCMYGTVPMKDWARLWPRPWVRSKSCLVCVILYCTLHFPS